MHPSRLELERFAVSEPDAPESQSIAEHIAGCESCRSVVDAHRRLTEFERMAENEALPDRALHLADSLFAAALRGAIVELTPLAIEQPPEDQWQLAADGEPRPGPAIQNLATFYSENPELVLQIMRDRAAGSDYLQVVADNQEDAAHLMVRLPELDREFVTDATGRAALEGVELRDVASLKWQLKMPDAVFSLQPLVFDPNRIEYEEQVTLESERSDRIRISLQGKPDSKLIRIELLEIGGQTDFGNVRVSISQGSESAICPAQADQPITFVLRDSGDAINIRLFE